MGGDCLHISTNRLAQMLHPKTSQLSTRTGDSESASHSKNVDDDESDFNISLPCIRNFVRENLKFLPGSESDELQTKRFGNSIVTLIHNCGKICEELRLSDLVPGEDGFPFCLYFCVEELSPQVYSADLFFCAVRASDGAMVSW